MAMAKVLNQERFLPPRLPGLSLWLDAQDITTISSSTAGVSSWADKSGMGNTMNSTTFSVPGCTLWLDASDPSNTGSPVANGTAITSWKDKSGLGNNATGASATTTTQYTTPLNTATTVTIPASSTVKVTVIGGGGGGGSGGAFFSGGGNGGVGGNGAVATYTFAASSVTAMTYYVGGGGNGGAYVAAFAEVGGNGGGGGQNSYVTIGTTTIYAGGGGGGGGGGGTTFSGQGGSAGIGSGGGSGGVGGAVAVYAAGGVGNPGSIINGSTGTRVLTYGNGGSGGSAGGGVGGVSGNNGLVIIEITPPPPTINSTGLNGYPTMNFNGTQWFTGPIVNTTSNLTVFAVVMLAGNAVYNSRIVSLATPTKVDYNTYTEVLALQQGYTNTWIATGRNTQPPTGGTFNFVAAIDYSTTSNVPYIAGALYNGTSSTQSLVVNGSVKSTNATTGAFGYTSYGIGNYSAAPGASEPFTGKISEILIFNTALTTFQRQQIEIYLSKKWQIPLSYSLPTTPLLFSPTSSSIPAISNTLTNQPSIFFPPGGQMGSILNSDLGAPTIPGCQLWLDAADTTTLTRSGSSVIEWRDKSGNGYNMNNTIGTFPVTGAAINGLNTVRFAAGSSIKQSTVVNGAKNFYWVGKIASANLDGYFFFLLGADYAYEWHANVIGAGNTYLYPYSANSPWVSLGIYNATASQYGGGSSAATNVAFSSLKYPPDGSLTMISATGITGNTYYQGLCYDRGDSTRGWRGDLAEVIIFNQPLTTAQHQQVEGYLATKWGLRANLPPTHPYFSLPYSGTFTLNPSTPVSKSLFMAYQCPQTSSSMRFAIGMDGPGLAFGLAQSNGTVYAPYQYGYGDTKWSVTPNTYIVPTVTSAIFDAGATMIRGDHAFNSFLDVRESALVNTIPNSPYILGAAPIEFSSVFISASFHVCEIIAYNRALGTTDRQMIEGYLAWKWGMTTQLPNGHPYQKFPPTGEQVVVATTPSNLYSGLVSWLDMADSTTYTLSGTSLKTLNDKVSGSGSYTISGTIPVSTLGSLPSLSFGGNNSAILQSGGFLFKTLTVPPRGCAFAVFTPSLTQLAAEKLGVLGWGSPGNNLNNPALGYTIQSSTTLRSYNPIDQTTSRFYGPSISLTVSKPAIVFWAWYNGNMVYLASNGNAVLSSPQTAGLFNAASTNNIFYIGNDGGFGANFNLGELCVYNDYLETPFRNVLEGYLAWKWGIQANLPSFHPYALSAPTLQTLTEVNALSQPTDISGLTMWLDAGDTATITGTAWLDKSAISNNLSGIITPSNFGPPARPSVYFGPGTSATSIYNSGADSKQFSAFLVASIPTLSYLLVSTGQLTMETTGAPGQTFGFYASNLVTSVFSPLVVSGTNASNNEVGNYSAISGKTFELFASICGTAVSGNMNFATPLSNVNNTAIAITSTPWVFGNCIGNTAAKSFHVHEFITYNRPITTLERQIIEGYLYWKWMV